MGNKLNNLQEVTEFKTSNVLTWDLFLVIIVYLVSVIRYIGGLKESSKEPYIIDNIMVTYSKITLVIYAIVMLICFYIINVLVQEEIKGVYK